MKEKILAVLLTALLICGGYYGRVESGTVVESIPGEQEMEIIILYDKEEQRLEDLVRQVQTKIGGTVYGIPMEEKQKEGVPMDRANLILIGGREENGDLSRNLKDYLAEIDFHGKKVSPFWLTESREEEPAYEEQFKNAVRNGILTPGIGVTWKENNRKDELGRIDGWLTTACTFRP